MALSLRSEAIVLEYWPVYLVFRFKAEDVTNQAVKHFATIKANIQPLL